MSNAVKPSKLNPPIRSRQKRGQKWLTFALLASLGILLLSLLFNVAVKLPVNRSKPVDAILVLGGSIRREIYAAQIANQDPKIPILIATGSKEPCVFLIFQREGARLNNIWLEKCGNSTFGNFFYDLPILKSWGVHKVKVITSPTHAVRAGALAKIHLGSQGIASEIVTVKEKGVPGNVENKLKTALDVGRSLIWALLSQVIHPQCSNVIALKDVDINYWHKEGFNCESQGKVEKG